MTLTRVETAELGLPAIDALDVDALAIFVGPERPLQGLAGYADWRLCGLLSRAIRERTYDPESGEALLLPSGGRIAVPRIFCFGQPAPARDAAALRDLAARACEAMARAGSAAWAGSLPAVAPGLDLPAVRPFVEALLRAPPRRLVLLGDALSLQRELLAVRDALQALQLEIAPLQARVEIVPRAGGTLPHPGAVVR